MSDGPWMQTQEQYWPDPTTGPFVLRLTFGPVDGAPAVIGTELWAVDPETLNAYRPGLALRPQRAAINGEANRLPLRRLLREWVEGMRRSAVIAKGAPSDSPSDWRTEMIEVAEAVDVRRRGRADAHSDEHWREVARIYLALGTKGVQEHFHIAKGTAAKWVYIARHDKNELAQTTRGRTSGRPGGDPGRAQ